MGPVSEWRSLRLRYPNDRLADHLRSKRQYGTEISNPLFPIHAIYKYDNKYEYVKKYEQDYEYIYEYEYEKVYVKLCGEISWLISTKLRAYPHYLCLGFVDQNNNG